MAIAGTVIALARPAMTDLRCTGPVGPDRLRHREEVDVPWPAATAGARARPPSCVHLDRTRSPSRCSPISLAALGWDERLVALAAELPPDHRRRSRHPRRPGPLHRRHRRRLATGPTSTTRSPSATGWPCRPTRERVTERPAPPIGADPPRRRRADRVADARRQHRPRPARARSRPRRQPAPPRAGAGPGLGQRRRPDRGADQGRSLPVTSTPRSRRPRRWRSASTSWP